MTSRLTIVREGSDPTATSAPVEWAIGQLQQALATKSIDAIIGDQAPLAGDWPVAFISGPGGRSRTLLEAAGVPGLEDAEAFAVVPTRDGRDDLLLYGSDERGLVYALLEIADRVRHADDASVAFPHEPVVGRPANTVRSVARLFCSEIEDKHWFYDESFWDRYLTMLVEQRFNRFSLTLGLGYNYHRGITDAYFYFAYPFLVRVPGYDVRVPEISNEEQARNLEMLRFISDEARRRALDFQLGLWTHAFQWIDSPQAHQTIEGLTVDRHAAYCGDAIRILLEECPSIGGLTFRIHGEGGIREGDARFWRTVFAGVGEAGRRVGIDLHAKGLDEPTLRLALDTGQPVTVSPKFWAEHMGLGYHQAAIRESERRVRADPSDRSEWHSYMSVSEGSRPFTRYGYADFLREDRGYDVVFRLWPGTQRVLLWGDPEMASAYGRSAHIAGTQGIEWMEPLTFKGREGSGVVGSRTGYRDPSFVPSADWEKFAYTYRLFGRLTYEPDAHAEGWRRTLPNIAGIEQALASASRILPLVTVAHHPSASNNYYWPELYTDMPIVWSEAGTRPHPYFDTPEPHRFGNVGPLDPELFSSVVDFVSEALSAQPTGRLSPLDVAARLEDLSEQASRGVEVVGDARGADLRRWSADIAILAGLGKFFSHKLRAAVWYEVFASTGEVDAIDRAITAYESAVDAWKGILAPARVYVDDLTFGPEQRLRGHWRSRLDAIEQDLQDMRSRSRGQRTGAVQEWGTAFFDELSTMPEGLQVEHESPTSFRPGQPLTLALHLRGGPLSQVELRYRPMNQSLLMSSAPTVRTGDLFVGSIPSESADGMFPLIYAFVIRTDDRAWRFPDLGDDLSSQPYFVVRPERLGRSDRSSETVG